MDVEGHEVEILRGMKETLKASSSGTKILMEIHPLIYNREEFRCELESIMDIGFYFKNLIHMFLCCLNSHKVHVIH